MYHTETVAKSNKMTVQEVRAIEKA
jgi:hypothetical protein